MSEIYERTNDEDSFSLGKELPGQLLVRYPWVVRLGLAEVVLLALAGVVPLLGASAFHYVLFGIFASLAGLGVVVFSIVGAVVGLRRGVIALQGSVGGLTR
jgi:hypothetical protein